MLLYEIHLSCVCELCRVSPPCGSELHYFPLAGFVNQSLEFLTVKFYLCYLICMEFSICM